MHEFVQAMLGSFREGGSAGVAIGFFDLSFLIFIVSTIGYTTYLVRRTTIPWIVGFGALLTGIATMTLALALRWIAASWEHPPWTNLYESLVFFSWGLVISYAVVEWKYKVKVVGAFVVPLVMIALGLASMSGNKEITPLMPALQSIWLHLHVFGASISYSMFIVAFAFAVLYLYRDGLSMPWFHGSASALSALCIVMVTKGQVIFGSFPFVRSVMHNGQLYKDQVPGSNPPVFNYVELKGVGTFAFVVFALFIASAVISWRNRETSDPKKLRFSFWAHFLPTVLMGMMLFHIGRSSTTVANFTLAHNVYGFALVVTAFFFAAMSLVLDGVRDKMMDHLPAARTLDTITYKAVMVAFPLLSFVIISGAIWANNAWGRYWGWDPKETSSLITWVVYLLYLHTRVTKGWMGRKTAIIAIVGFVSVIFTYLGVNLVISGLHSYAGA
ncbi:cytochrome c biogenesis protein CcsA [bacterium]|nr:cytochrome c biogenesis protein CcsA [bacterium]